MLCLHELKRFKNVGRKVCVFGRINVGKFMAKKSISSRINNFMVTKTFLEKLENKEMRYITEELRRFGYNESRKFKVKKAKRSDP